MNETHISDIVLSTNAEDHELSLPQLLVIWDMVVTGFTLSKLEESSVTVESDIQSFELLGISLIKAENQCLVWNLLTLDRNMLSAEINLTSQLLDWKELDVPDEFSEDGVGVIVELIQAGEHLVVSVLGSTVRTIVELVLAAQSVVSFKSEGFVNQCVNLSGD